MVKQFLAALLLIACSVPSQAGCSRPLRKYLQDWRPYTYTDAQGRASGLDNDMVTAVAKEAGCTIEFLPEVPGRRGLNMFSRGEIDIMTGFSMTQDRLPFTNYTRAYRDEVVAIFSLAGAVRPEQIQSYADIPKLRLHLVAPLSGFWGQGFAEAEAELKAQGALSRVEGDAQTLKMLSGHHGDLVLGDEMVIPYTAKQLGMAPLQRVKLEANRDKVYFGLSKVSTTAEDLKAIDDAVGRLLANGTLDKIYKKYGFRK